MATDECLGAQAQGRQRVLIQNGDWCGILPQPTYNFAETAQSNQGVIHGTRSARDGRLCACWHERRNGDPVFFVGFVVGCSDLLGGVITAHCPHTAVGVPLHLASNHASEQTQGSCRVTCRNLYPGANHQDRLLGS